MAQVIPSSDRSLQTREAVGAAFGLLGTFIAAMFFAYFLPRLAFYVTFLMPVLVGFLLSAVGAIGPRRFGFGNPKALIAFMVVGSLVVWVGHHVLAYLNVIDYLASKGTFEPGADRIAETVQWLKGDMKVESGFWAYLTLVSGEKGANMSPVGLLGRSELGATGTMIVAVVELVLMAVTASWTILFRTRALRTHDEAMPLALVDTTGLAAMMKLIEERRFDDAGAALAQSEGSPSHVVMLKDGDVTTEVSVHTLDALGRPAQKVGAKLVAREGGEQLRRAYQAGRRGA